MSAGTITITAGRERDGNENDFAGPDGTYSVILVRVTDPVTAPSTMGKSETWTYRDWTFAIDGGEFDGQVIDVRASCKAGPSSKQVRMITALFGKVPPVGTQIDIQKHLVGRGCLAAIQTNDAGYPYVDSFMSAPSGGGRAAAPKPEPAPAAAAPAEGDDSGLPF